MITLLLDADILIYKNAVRNEQDHDFVKVVDYDKAVVDLKDEIESLKGLLNADEVIVCMSCRSRRYWRHDIYPSYKSSRKGGPRPELLFPLKDFVTANYRTYERPNLEADDIMGILATHPTAVKGKKVIVSTDKDMLTIPGSVYRGGEFPVEVTPWHADYNHAFQTLMGDSCDGYPGCPRIGRKRAADILEPVLKGDCEGLWDAVEQAFAVKGKDREFFLTQARLARICRAEDYDFKERKVKLWNPILCRV